MPGRQAAEHLAVLHREVLRHPVRAAHRIGADAQRRGLLDARHVLLPLVRAAHRLRQAVVDDGAAASPRRGARIMPSLSSTYWPPPAWIVPVPSSRSTSASAKISFSSAHSAGIGTPCGSKWPFSRDTERPSAPAFMPSRTTSCIALICVVGGARLLAVVAHHVVAHRGVADQIADIDAEVLVELVHVLRDRLPIELDGASAPPSGSLRHRRGTRRAAPRCPCAPAPATASNCRRSPWSRRARARRCTAGPR